ncbi:uncharacterized protein LOC126355734 [Schistocerca gregaria]|uniref:uncharacterized protein LOC126355734 n=1 Tax=Schistocerca gregaria TaxID=7010 RepID=UPI00211E4BBD|nr:uncharacterized protein LOC126355734 [Schistocerca gregaria]
MANRSVLACCVLALLVSSCSAKPEALGGLLGGVVGTVGGVVGGVVEGVAQTAISLLELPRVLLLTGLDFFLNIFQVCPPLKAPLYDVVYPQGTLTVEFVNTRLNQCVTILNQLVAQKQLTLVQAQDILAQVQLQLKAVLAGKLNTALLVPVHL